MTTRSSDDRTSLVAAMVSGAVAAETPWLSEDHWKAGDQAWWILETTDGISKTKVEIVSPEEGTVRDPKVTYNDGVFRATGKFEYIRHRGGSCAKCAGSVLELSSSSPHSLVEEEPR
ncbi:hypothetical protein DBV08_18445 [Rhodococcus sp. KBW08]|uniref:hypothetical protein n=1 Tax=Rhodococcus sp. KBW08 TaxID=2144188 RepID=UPI000F5B32C6|nr:hypothetical protein [Rhodococcus sp. KBW08]RQO45851.1 hypothetical protein DBV08_18445 [Rhodococcus sp. KBW08]